MPTPPTSTSTFSPAVASLAFSYPALDPTATLCLTGDRNSPDKPADFTGAFLPEILAFMKLHGIDPGSQHKKVDLSQGDLGRFQQVLDFTDTTSRNVLHKAPTCLVFCCHGLQNKIQVGLKTTNLDQVSALLRKLHTDLGTPNTTDMTVVLYCCSTGGGPGPGGDGGFADDFRDSLCRAGFTTCRVYGHEVSGHAVKNPFKRLFEGMGSPVGGCGGYPLVAQGTPLFPKWRKALASGDLRFRYPWMTVADIHKELLATP